MNEISFKEDEMDREQRKQEMRPRVKRALLLSLMGCVLFFAAMWLGVRLFSPYYAFIPCGILVILACLLHNLKNGDRTCAIAALCNAAACGLAASVYFTALGIALPPLVLACALGAFFALLVLTYALTASPLRQTVLSVLVTVLYLASLVLLVCLWCTQPIEDPMWALATLSFLFYTFSLIPFMLVREEDDVSADRTISFWSFSVAIVVLLAVLTAIALASGDGCDCDCAPDCCDCGGSDGKSKKKKR